MNDAVEVRELTKRYGTVQALDGIDLRIAPGEVFGLLGRNGSGKTTTVRILTTLTAPTSGHANVLGLSVVRDAAAIRRRIGATMQEAALDAGMTGREHLLLAAGLWGMSRRDRRAQADDLLERFALTDTADRQIGTYSGGMQRRLDIATALLSGPAALFLDEPTAGLDPQSRRALWEEIRTLSAEGTTIFLTTQYLEEAEALTSRVAVIDAGKIVADGSVAELKARHGRTRLDLRPARTDELARVLDSLEPAGATERAGVVHIELKARHGRTRLDLRPARTDDLARVLDSLEPAGATERAGVVHIEVETARAAREITAIIAGLRDQRIELDSIAVRESSLEDVFVQLTGSAIS